MQAGRENTIRLINVTKIHQSLGNQLCRALSAFHACKGCDYNPSLYRLGKIKPLELLNSSGIFMKAFIKISQLNYIPDFHDYSKLISSEVFKTFENFLCTLYGHPTISCMHQLRVKIFQKTFKVKNPNQFFFNRY